MTRSIALLGSTGSIGRQTLEVARELGLTVAALTANSSVDLIEQQAREFCPRLAVLYDEAAAAELRERLRVEYKQVYSPDHPVPYAELLNEQTEPVMRELHERGVKCAIASSSYRELIDELVEIAGIADVLDYTISGHECSAFKPDPEIYLRAMEALGVEPSECLVIEDSPLGIEAGKRSGARVLALRPHEGVHLDQSRADAGIDNLTDILAAL